MTLLFALIGTLAFAIVAPVLGCLLAGLDRKISARMQGRVGPPLLQPYYDVRKLIEKDNVSVNSTEGTYVTCALVFTLIAGGIFFSGGNLLMSVFVITLRALFFIVAAYSTRRRTRRSARTARRCRSCRTSPWCCSWPWRSTWPPARSTPRACSPRRPRGHEHLARVPGLAVRAHHQAAQVAVRPVLLAPRAPGNRQGHHHRDERQDAREGGDHALVRERAVPGLGRRCSSSGATRVSIVLALVVVVLVYFLEIWIDNNFARVKWQALLVVGVGRGVRGGLRQHRRLWRTCKERRTNDVRNEITVGHPLRRLELQRLRHRGAGGAVPRASTSSVSASSTRATPSTPTSSSSRAA